MHDHVSSWSCVLICTSISHNPRTMINLKPFEGRHILWTICCATTSNVVRIRYFQFHSRVEFQGKTSKYIIKNSESQKKNQSIPMTSMIAYAINIIFSSFMWDSCGHCLCHTWRGIICLIMVLVTIVLGSRLIKNHIYKPIIQRLHHSNVKNFIKSFVMSIQFKSTNKKLFSYSWKFL